MRETQLRNKIKDILKEELSDKSKLNESYHIGDTFDVDILNAKKYLLPQQVKILKDELRSNGDNSVEIVSVDSSNIYIAANKERGMFLGKIGIPIKYANKILLDLVYENGDEKIYEDEDNELESDEEEDIELNEDYVPDGEYQMDIVMEPALSMIEKIYSQWEEDSYDNYGQPVEIVNVGDWSTRNAKVEILETILEVLNKVSAHTDDKITIK